MPNKSRRTEKGYSGAAFPLKSVIPAYSFNSVT